MAYGKADEAQLRTWRARTICRCGNAGSSRSDDAKALRASIRGRMHELLGDDAILILPTAPGIAPSRNLPPAQSENFRARALELLCLAGHAGLPQISLPVASMEGCPIGLSILAPQDQDEVLMAFAKRLYGACH
jgi:amidase